MVDRDQIVGAAKNVAGQAERAIGEGVGSVDTQATGATREFAGAVQQTYGQVKDAARDAVGQGAEVVKDTVHERPGSSLLVAGLIGFALGVILTRQPSPPRRYRWMHD